MDDTVTDQTSILRFVEDNWLGGTRIGNGSFDGIASSISQKFDFQSEEHTAVSSWIRARANRSPDHARCLL